MTNLYVFFNWHPVEYRHEFIKNIIERGDINQVGAISKRRRNYDFLVEQDEIKYEPIHLVQDVENEITKLDVNDDRLAQIEDQYGTPYLWPTIVADKDYIKDSHYKQRQFVQGWFNFYEKIFSEFNPDVFLTSAVDSMYTWIPFEIVQRNYGKSLKWKHTRIRNRCGILQNKFDDFEDIHRLFDNLQNPTSEGSEIEDSEQKAEIYLNNFREDSLRPSFTTSNSNKTPLHRYITGTLEYFYQYHFTGRKEDIRESSTLEKIAEELSPLVRKRYLNRTNKFTVPDYERDEFVFFPLHLQPEASTMVLAPMYVHQRDLIRKLSKSIPLNYKLYVKEHPNMFGKRESSYYDEINRISNVKLIHPEVDSHKLIRESELVTTISGTAGLEGALLQRPVVAFGRPHYRVLSTVFTAGDPNQLGNQIERAINEYTYDDEEILNYLTAIFKESYEFPKKLEGNAQEQALNQLADAIVSKIEVGGNS